MQQTQTFEKHSPLPPRAPHFSRLSIFKFVSSPSKILQSFPLLPQSCMYTRAREHTCAGMHVLSSRNVWLGEGGVRKRPPATE